MTTEFKSWDELSELEQLEVTYCEMHKDVYGVKARWYRAESVEQARKDLETLGRALDAELEREAAEQQEAIAKFNKRIEDTIAAGAGDRETALRWIMDADDCPRRDDWDYLCYVNGLPYGFFRETAKAC